MKKKSSKKRKKSTEILRLGKEFNYHVIRQTHTLDFINGIVDKDSFVELHGDRNFADDPAMVGGLAK